MVTKLKDSELAAVRHMVYTTLLGQLPPASGRQTERFVTNLALLRRPREKAEHFLFLRMLWLKVTPDDNETGRKYMTLAELERHMNQCYGEYLQYIAGFYRREGEINGMPRFALNLPHRSNLIGYQDDHGHWTGVMCQPFDRHDLYFLLSSAKYDGPRAVPMRNADRQFYEQYKLPATPPKFTMPAEIGERINQAFVS